MLENLKIPTRKYPCRVGDFYATLSEADKEILMSYLADPNVADKALETALRQEGITIADTSIAKHRRGLCSCSRI